jgi:hypothetical protein
MENKIGMNELASFGDSAQFSFASTIYSLNRPVLAKVKMLSQIVCLNSFA